MGQVIDHPSQSRTACVVLLTGGAQLSCPELDADGFIEEVANQLTLNGPIATIEVPNTDTTVFCAHIVGVRRV